MSCRIQVLALSLVAVGASLPAAPPAASAQAKNHWAFQPVKCPPVPVVRNRPFANPIDAFVQAKSQESFPAADRRTLIRRVTFDLIGLPPTPKEIDAFLSDKSPEAFAKVVDRLLASPHCGEHWGRHWLDVVRYAESTANDSNAVLRYAWRYRDYVIDAFKRDLPYDRFIIEQLAGDLLPPTSDKAENARRIIATGFLMIGPEATRRDRQGAGSTRCDR